MKVLREESLLKELDVVNILKELTTTIFSCEEYIQSRLELYLLGSYSLIMRDALYYRKQLEETLKFYEAHMRKSAHEPKPLVITESLIGMVFLCTKMGEHDTAEYYFERTLQELRLNFREAVPLKPSVSST